MKKLLALLITALLAISPLSALPALAGEIASDYTPLGNSSSAKIDNIQLAISALDGTYVGYGDTFSFNDVVGPRTKDNGYQTAVNGRGSKVRGGGVSQVATTLYLALQQLGTDIRYKERKTYGSKFTDGYVSSGDDAIITDYGADTDFRFENNYSGFIINCWISDGDVWCSLTDSSDGGWEGGDDSASGYGSTPIRGNNALYNNIELCADSIYDTTLTHGEIFSFNDVVGPREERYGYENAINGRGVKVRGGGVAQVASTIWLAVKNMDCVEIVEKKTYGDKYNQSYVSSSKDAIVTDYSAGTDFRFRYTGYGTLTIYTYVTDDTLYCDVYEE